MEWMAKIEKLKERTSLRGIVMTILSVVVLGLAIAMLRYTPSPPDEGQISPAQTSSPVPVIVPSPAPGPAVEPPVSTPAGPPMVQSTIATPTYSPPPTYSPAPTPTSSATPTTTATTGPSEQPAFPIRPTHAQSDVLPNGGRRS
ncbi:conserved exported hypothetical protein [uncultured Mycobacterium sp.]|uniref:Uncharacterized protein n=1 Tax=uncultured Mycobacterium sp. TaxID=171292 RepID=A0A1Y5PKB7_9MYCO|nr:conserved exported hypothetical protein [uncultured Mycobacterium sp.]